jgi:methylenetetrahydrofolate dehydrogenase (NADP+)/methenyltetrahydrofolate cyclohydrolase
MTARLLDGKAIATDVRAQVSEGAARFAREWGRPPRLDLVLVSDDPGSQGHVRNKNKAALAAGLASRIHTLATDVDASRLEAVIDDLNADDEVDGILVQLPLPTPLASAEAKILARITPAKDVDGLHPLNALVIGRSNIVGRPVFQLLLAANATVTVAHSHSSNLADLCQEADVLVVAAGKPRLVRGAWIKPGAVVIDVGLSRNAEGKLVGDVAFDEALERASWISPVPGGVGPLTIACLLENTVDAAMSRAATRSRS